MFFQLLQFLPLELLCLQRGVPQVFGIKRTLRSRQSGLALIAFPQELQAAQGAWGLDEAHIRSRGMRPWPGSSSVPETEGVEVLACHLLLLWVQRGDVHVLHLPTLLKHLDQDLLAGLTLGANNVQGSCSR